MYVGHVQEIGCCSGAKVHTTERYKGLAGRGPRPSDLSDQKWGAPRKGNNGNGELEGSSQTFNELSVTFHLTSRYLIACCFTTWNQPVYEWGLHIFSSRKSVSSVYVISWFAA